MAPTSVDSARRQEDASGSEEARHGQRHIGALRRLGGLFNRFDHYLCALSHRGVCCGGHTDTQGAGGSRLHSGPRLARFVRSVHPPLIALGVLDR